MSIQIKVGNQKSLLRQVELVKLPAARRRKITKKIGQQVKKKSKTRLKEQRNVDGSKWESRRDGRKRKMLRKIGKGLVIKNDQNKVDLTFNNYLVGRIANEHHQGFDVPMDAQKAKKRNGTPNYQGSATRKQAKALREVGYKIKRANGKGWKKPTIKWVTENIKLGQAGLVLRLMREEQAKTEWVIPLPERTFLGASNKDVDNLLDEVMKEILSPVKKKG